jgi:multidrug resistance efflux pump
MIRRILPVLVLSGVVAGYFGYQHWLSLRPYQWSGTIEAHSVSLGSHQGGRVASILVTEGDVVTAGQALAIFETGDLEAQQHSAQGQVDLADAALRKLEKGVRREQIAASRSRVEGAEVALTEATTRARRAQSLFDAGAAPQADLDSVNAARDSADATLAAARHQLEELHNGAVIEDIDAARAQLAVANAKLEQVQVAIAELTVKAPRAGRIESVTVRPGDILPPNATTATLVEDDQLYVRIYVPETQLGHVSVGATVPVSVDSFPERTFAGRVDHVNSVGEFSPRNLQTADERADQVFGTRITLLEGTDTLRAGMAAFIAVPK